MRLARGNHVLICTKEDESGEGAERQSLQPFLLELESRFAPNDRIQRECKFEVFSAGHHAWDTVLSQDMGMVMISSPHAPSWHCTVENCIFCTGMWHPLSGGFCGYKRKKKNRR
uniref:Uncharacterized protein n=1 Tax=Oryza meridionalis TaxID=40149 RepID=A0A0E0E349_9ORYZ